MRNKLFGILILAGVLILAGILTLPFNALCAGQDKTASTLYQVDFKKLVSEAEANIKLIEEQIQILQNVRQRSSPAQKNKEAELRQLRMEIALLKLEYIQSAK